LSKKKNPDKVKNNDSKNQIGWLPTPPLPPLKMAKPGDKNILQIERLDSIISNGKYSIKPITQKITKGNSKLLALPIK
jgi:hypothetical protein